MRAFTYLPSFRPAPARRRSGLPETAAPDQSLEVRQLLGRGGPGLTPHPQAKSMRVGAPGDQYEQEADRVADALVKGQGAAEISSVSGGRDSTRVQRKCTACEDELDEASKQQLRRSRGEQEAQRQPEEEEEVLQAKARSGAGGEMSRAGQDQVQDTLGRAGRPLDRASREFAEQGFGMSFDHVRIHTDASAAASAEAIHSRAYTVGNQIVFGQGQYNPGTLEGRRLLSHELTHVVQQGGGGEFVQRDFALEPPNGDADGRVLSAAEMQDAIAFNTTVMSSIPNSAAMIELLRDVLGVAPIPAVIDEALVNAILDWQASYGLTQDGKLGPRSARPLFREIGAEGAGRCEVDTGPRYSTGAILNSTPDGAGGEFATFNMLAEFKSDPANNVLPSCCEVRQLIAWDAAAVPSFAPDTVIHSGFPPGHPADRWIEDRDDADQRYGHRAGPHSDPGDGDQYLDASGQQNQAFGHRFEGRDSPGIENGNLAGQWRFALRVLDVCNNHRRVGNQDYVRVNW